jgi:quinol monooxygenase YgiN
VVAATISRHTPSNSEYLNQKPTSKTAANTPYRYDDDATFYKHLAADVVSKTLFDWSRGIPNIWTKDPTVQNFTVIDGMNFVKPEFAKAKDPYIVVEALTYMAGGVHHVIDHWEEEVDASRNETGTLAFGLYTDPINKDKLWTLAAYESEEYLTNTHAKSPTARELEEHTSGMRTSKQQTLLEKRGGFLYKGSEACG